MVLSANETVSHDGDGRITNPPSTEDGSQARGNDPNRKYNSRTSSNTGRYLGFLILAYLFLVVLGFKTILLEGRMVLPRFGTEGTRSHYSSVSHDSGVDAIGGCPGLSEGIGMDRSG